MGKKLEKLADLLLRQHGFNEHGKKTGKGIYHKSKKPIGRAKEKNIIFKNKDLIKERKLSELSDPELIIAHLLAKDQIRFTREYFMVGLYNPKTKKPLFFDFYLPDYNMVIEYDGVQHYKDKDEKRLQRQKDKDEIKNQFCRQRKIKMLRIPYWKQGRLEYVILEYFDKLSGDRLKSFTRRQ